MEICETCGLERDDHGHDECNVCGRSVNLMDVEACGDCDNHVCDQHPTNICPSCDIAKCDRCWTSDNGVKPAELNGEEVCGVCVEARAA